MAIELQRIVPGVKGDAGVDTGRTSAAKINDAFDALEEVANEQYPGKMDINGLNSSIINFILSQKTYSYYLGLAN